MQQAIKQKRKQKIKNQSPKEFLINKKDYTRIGMAKDPGK